MSRSVAINVGANTGDPGFRGPVYPDGSFEFVPIPEREPTAEAPPTYADLPLELPIPQDARDLPVHLDPEFAGYADCERYTYGDPWGVKARPLLDLAAGDWVFFYATLAPRDHGGAAAPTADAHPGWVTPEWGAYLIGAFHLARDPIPGEAYADLPADERRRFATNAHVRREIFDAAVLLRGDDRSRLYERPVSLSGATGAVPNGIVTDLSADSGAGPWWRRPLRFDEDATRRLRERIAAATGSA